MQWFIDILPKSYMTETMMKSAFISIEWRKYRPMKLRVNVPEQENLSIFEGIDITFSNSHSGPSYS